MEGTTKKHDPETIRVNVMLCPRAWKKLRHRAINEGKSGSEVLRDLMRDALECSAHQDATCDASKQ